MNGLGYSKDYGKTFGLAITMDGSIVSLTMSIPACSMPM